MKDRVKTFPVGQENVVPGITSFPCLYHTPGSSAYILTPEEGQPLFYAGDCLGIESLTINNQYVPFAFPTSISFHYAMHRSEA